MKIVLMSNIATTSWIEKQNAHKYCHIYHQWHSIFCQMLYQTLDAP